MSYNDLRKGRCSEPGRAYHVTAVTLGRAPLFRDFCAGRVVVHQLRRLQEEGLAETLCFVVMPDHLHWLLVLQRGTLSESVKRLKARSARELGGRLWQPGFHDHALRREEDLHALARYIAANPLRAGLVRHLGDYPLWDAAWLAEGMHDGKVSE
jgi:REP element-mobilizing transposase RayT